MRPIDSIIPFPDAAVAEHANENDHPRRLGAAQKFDWPTRDRGEYRYALDVARYAVCVDRNGLLESSLNDVTSVAAGTSSHAA